MCGLNKRQSRQLFFVFSNSKRNVKVSRSNNNKRKQVTFIQQMPSSPASVGSAVGWFGQPYNESHSLDAVSYTHLDVYKRQVSIIMLNMINK